MYWMCQDGGTIKEIWYDAGGISRPVKTRGGKWDEYLARCADQDKIRQNLRIEWARAEAPLVSALRLVGVNVQSVWDLVDREMSYPAAISLLFKHAKKNYPDRVREDIVCALGTPLAWEYLDELVDYFENNSLRFSLEIRHAAALHRGCSSLDF